VQIGSKQLNTALRMIEPASVNIVQARIPEELRAVVETRINAEITQIRFVHTDTHLKVVCGDRYNVVHQKVVDILFDLGL